MHNDGIINSLHYVVGPHGSMYDPHGRREVSVINVAKYGHRLYHAIAAGRVYNTRLFKPL